MPVLTPVTLPTSVHTIAQSKSQVAIVIAGRNSAKFLAEAIDSALSQKVPCEVVYADDHSIDSSLEIASSFIHRGLRVIPSGVHSGVCETRNRGALATSAPYIIFMDADDRMPSDYTSLLLSDAIPSVPFVYPNTRAFGAMECLWKNLEWDSYDRWARNQVSTTALWNRTAFMAAGMWQSDIPTMWDYDLALRCSRFGKPVAGKATLDYRIHNASVSSQLGERLEHNCIQYAEMIRRKNATIGIGSLVSGRLPGLFRKWMDALACSVRYALASGSLRHKPILHLLLHNNAQQFTAHYLSISSQYSDTFTSIELSYIDKPSPQNAPESDRRQFVCRLLADASNRMQASLPTDICWFVEDDVVVPIKAAHVLFKHMTASLVPPIGVSGSYMNRHGTGTFLGGWIRYGLHHEPSVSFGPEDIVDFVGSGCLMYWKDRPGTPKTWKPISKIENATAHDWAWSEEVKGDLKIIGSIICDHYQTETEWV